MNNEQIRAEARDLLQDKWWSLVLIWLIIYALSALSGVTGGLSGIVSLIIGGPLALGVCIVFLKLWRREEYRTEELFDGFKDFSRSLVAYLLVVLYVFLWSLLLIVPGIIACISYSMTFFIMAEDPKISGQDAMRKSQQMMHGHKTEYFMLMLSFIGWFILSMLVAGLGMLLLSSYTTMASMIFYQRLKGVTVQQPQQEIPAPTETL